MIDRWMDWWIITLVGERVKCQLRGQTMDGHIDTTASLHVQKKPTATVVLHTAVSHKLKLQETIVATIRSKENCHMSKLLPSLLSSQVPI